MTENEFVVALQKEQTRLNLTDQQLADLIPVSIPTLRRWREIKSLPTLFMRDALIKELKKLKSNA